MFYEDIFNNDFFKTDYGRKIKKYDEASCTYSFMYRYWVNNLFERVMRLFIWKGPEKSGIDPKEIELRLITAGHCGITKIDDKARKYYKNVKGGLTAMFGSFATPTEYYDEWIHYIVRCPLYTDKKTIGKNVVVINNNAVRNRTYELIHHYATLLGHNEVTIINALIGARDSGGVPIASTDKQAKSIREYQNKLFNGQYGVVTDRGNLGVQYVGADRHTQQEILALVETRDRLLKSFYADMGVRSNFDKRNNTVEAEVEADTSMLLLNLSDMLKQREKACEEVNKMFGTKWSVKIAEEIDYGTENEQKPTVKKLPTNGKKVTNKKEAKNNA